MQASSNLWLVGLGAKPDGETDKDIDLLRQKVIVRLLRESSLTAEPLRKCVEELCRHGILTADVYEEATSLLMEKDAALPLQDLPKVGMLAQVPKEQAVAPVPFDSRAAPANASRFNTDFERLEVLGQGAFGEVWRARNKLDQKEYAVKVIPFHINADENPLDHPALREAKTLASVTHTNLVRYHSAWVEVDTTTELCATAGGGQAGALENVMEVAPLKEDRHGQSDSTTVGLDSISTGSSGGIVFEASSRHSNEVAEATSDAIRKQSQLQLVPTPPKQPMACKRRVVLFVQMELVRGGTLRDWIERRNAAVAEDSTQAQRWLGEAGKIFGQCVSVLDYLGKQSVIHRDIKPSNILLTEDGDVRLGDLGLATMVGNEAQDVGSGQRQEGGRQTLAKTTGIGTPAYASPEQLSKQDYGPEADTYSLGIVLAELLCPVQTQMERVRLIEGLRQGHLPADVVASYPDASRLVLEMTSEDPTARRSISEMAQCMRARNVNEGGGCPAGRLPSAAGQVQGHGSCSNLEALGGLQCRQQLCDASGGFEDCQAQRFMCDSLSGLSSLGHEIAA